MTLSSQIRQDPSPQLPSDEQVNLHIGKRIRRRRRLMGLTQGKLSLEVGLQFQQIQKYECAANKVCGSRLYFLAAALHVPVQYYYDGLPLVNSAETPANDRHAPDFQENMLSNEALDLVQSYFRLAAPIRRKLREFARALGEEPA